jgi:hypothetical protein
MTPEEKLNRLENGLKALGKSLEKKGSMSGDVAEMISSMLKLIRK